jgi:hypothetical protein
MKTGTGKYVVKTAKGAMAYNPKVKFYKNPAGSTVNVKYVHGNVTIPTPIRPKIVRKIRANRGEARGRYAPRIGGVRVLPMKRAPYALEMFEGYKPKRAVGRPRKHLVSPGARMGLAGMKIMPRRGRPTKAKAGMGMVTNARLRSATPM